MVYNIVTLNLTYMYPPVVNASSNLIQVESVNFGSGFRGVGTSISKSYQGEMASVKGKVAIIGRYMKCFNFSFGSFDIYLTSHCIIFGTY